MKRATILVIATFLSVLLFSCSRKSLDIKATVSPSSANSSTTPSAEDSYTVYKPYVSALLNYDETNESKIQIAQVHTVELKAETTATVILFEVYCFNSPIFSTPVLVVDTGEYIISEILCDGCYSTELTFADITGDSESEIIAHHETGSTGGAGSYDAYVYKLSGKDMERIFSYPTHDGDSRNAIYAGFELMLADGWIFQIRNVYADLFLEFTRDTDKDYPYFDENGDLSKRGIEQNKTKTLGIDSSFLIFTPVDIDNDGVYEIMTAQYSYLYDRSDAIGSCYTILKWDIVKQLFEIVQAGFWPYSNEDSDAWQEYESIWYRKEFP